MARKNLGTLTVDLIAKMGGFMDGMSKAERQAYKSMRGVKKEVGGADKAVQMLTKSAKYLTGALITAAGGAVAMVKSQASNARETLNLAEAIGISTERLSAGMYAAKQYNIEQSKYGDIIKDVSDKVGDFIITGAGPMADFFETVGPKVGVAADMFRELNGADALQLYVSSLDKANLSQNEMVFFMEAIASDASLLLPLLRNNGQEMNRLAAEASDLGVVLDRETAEAAREFEESLGKVNTALFGNYDLLRAATPIMDKFANTITDPRTLQGLKTLVEGVGDLAIGLVETTAEMANFIKWAGQVTGVFDRDDNSIADQEEELWALQQRYKSLKEYLDTNILLRGKVLAFSPGLWDEDLSQGGLDDLGRQIDEQKEYIRSLQDQSDIVKKLTEESVDLSYVLEGLGDAGEEGGTRTNWALEKAEGRIVSVAEQIRIAQGFWNEFGFWENSVHPFDLQEAEGRIVSVAEQIKLAQGYWNEFGFWENSVHPFDETTDAVDRVATEYNQLGQISGSVMRGLVHDADSAFDGIGNMFKDMLAQMADDALRNAIAVQVDVEGNSSGGGEGGNAAGGAMAAMGWWAVVAVAVAAAADEWNGQQDEKFKHLTAEVRQGSQGTGTLLGALNEKSQSLNVSIEHMQKTASDALSVNWGMLHTLQDIRTGITGVAAGFARTGFGSTGGDVFSAVEFGSMLANGNERHGAWTPTNVGTAVSMGFEHDLLTRFDDAGISIFGDLDTAALNLFDGLAESISKNIYRESTSLQDSGIEIFSGSLAAIIDGGLVEAQAYADVLSEKKLFGLSLGADLETMGEQLDEQTRKQLTSVFGGAAESLEFAAGIFGIDFGSVAGDMFISSARLSLKDLEGDELTAAIETFFSAQLDDWAKVLLGGTVGSGALPVFEGAAANDSGWAGALSGVASRATAGMDEFVGPVQTAIPILDDFQQVGEGAFETVMRLAGETNYYTDIMDRLGMSLNATGLEAVYATQWVIAAAGGLDALSADLSTFSSQFIPQAEQLEMLGGQLGGVFDRLGRAMPENREAFRDLVQGIDQTTEEGAKLFAELIGLSGPMSQYLAGLEAEEKLKQQLADQYTGKQVELLRLQGRETEAMALQRELELSAMDESLHGIQMRIYALQDEQAAMAALQSATDAALGNLRKATANEIQSLTDDFAGVSASLQVEYDAKAESLGRWLDTQLGHYERRARTLNESIAELNELSGAISSATGLVRGQFDTGIEDYGYSAAAIDALARQVAGGGALPAAAEIDRLSGGLGDAQQFFGNTAEFVIAQAAISRNLDYLQQETGKALSIEEKILAGIESSEQSAQRNHDAMLGRYQAEMQAQLALAEQDHLFQVQALEEQLASFEQQVNALRGIEDAVPGIEMAVRQMQSTMAAEQAETRKSLLDAIERQSVSLGGIARNTGDTADAVEDLVRELRGAA